VALILAAEDDPDTRALVTRILQRAGHDVIGVADGESALREIRNHRPDLVLSDVDMPLVNGFLLCDEVRRDPQLRHIPVILATGVIDPDDHRAVEVGAASVLTKPFTAGDLLDRVTRHLPAHESTARSP
jgi:CheY-like chemotaxis protein